VFRSAYADMLHDTERVRIMSVRWCGWGMMTLMIVMTVSL